VLLLPDVYNGALKLIFGRLSLLQFFRQEACVCHQRGVEAGGDGGGEAGTALWAQ